jgi:hypothetical protein
MLSPIEDDLEYNPMTTALTSKTPSRSSFGKTIAWTEKLQKTLTGNGAESGV